MSPEAGEDCYAPAVRRERDAIGSNSWQCDRFRTIEPSYEGTARAAAHTDHRHGPAVRSDGRSQTGKRAGFHIVWEPDVEVRHRQGGYAGRWTAPEGPSG